MQPWSAPLAAVLLLAPASPQDSARLVDDLIARSNALKSFVATYQVHYRSTEPKPQELEGVLRIVYRAPEEMSVEFKTGSDGARTVVAKGKCTADFRQDGKTVQRGATDVDLSLAEARARIDRVFREQFPGLGDLAASQGPEVFVRFRVKPGTDAVRPEFKVEAGVDRGESALLGWLDIIRRSNATIVADGDACVWEPAAGIRVFLRKDCGFVQKIVVTFRGETKTRLELSDLVLDPEVGDAEFGFPDADPSVEDISASMGRSWEIGRLLNTRGILRRKIREGIESGKLEWTSDVRAHLGALLRAFHEELAPVIDADAMRGARATVDEFCLWYQDAKQSIHAGEGAESGALEAQRTEWEARFRESVEKAVEPYVTRAVPEVEDANGPKVFAEVRAVELEAAEAACRKTVVEPALEYFAKQMELAGRGELPPAKEEKR